MNAPMNVTTNPIFAYCGLHCHLCPIHMATREKDREEQEEMRDEIAEVLTEKYGMKCEPADVTDCDGCPVEGGQLFPACRNCTIRSCVRSKGLANCAYCGKYACEQLKAFFDMEPEAKTRLDEIRRGLQ